MKPYLVLLKVFILSALLIVSNNNLQLKNPENREQFVEIYHAWLSEFFDKAVYVTGYVVKSEWLPNSNFTMSGDEKLGR